MNTQELHETAQVCAIWINSSTPLRVAPDDDKWSVSESDAGGKPVREEPYSHEELISLAVFNGWEGETMEETK